MAARRRASVTEGRPTEAGLVVPSAALEDAPAVGERGRGPLEDVADGVEHPIRARAARVPSDRRRAADAGRLAVEALAVPRVTPREDRAAVATRGLLPLGF